MKKRTLCSHRCHCYRNGHNFHRGLPVVGNITMYVYTANGKTLNLRAENANTSATIVANIPYGAAVNVYEPYKQRLVFCWLYYGTTGYVMSRFLVVQPARPQAHVQTLADQPHRPSKYTLSNTMFDGFASVNYQVKVLAHGLPPDMSICRWAPSLNADIYSRNYMGDILTVIAANRKWSQVMNEKNIVVGFMMSRIPHPLYG